jgi:hypothetical protein
MEGVPAAPTSWPTACNNTGVSLGRAMVSFSPETVQEFSVQTSAFSAEYGQTGGGIISATTKSGTNNLNGTLLWYNRNPVFAAAPWTMATQNRPRPTLKYNQFSLAAGGPVLIPKIYDGRNKTFWFAAYEPRYRRDFLPQDTCFPPPRCARAISATWSPPLPATFRRMWPGSSIFHPMAMPPSYNQFAPAGNQFTRLAAPAAGATYEPFPNNVIPKSMLDATALKAVKLIADPGAYYINSAGTISNFFNPRLLSQNDKRFTMRVDHSITDRNRINVRYTATPIVKTQLTPASPTTDSADYSWAKQAMLSDTHTLSATMLNDLRLNYTRGRFSTVPSIKYDPFSGENLNTELGLPSITRGGVPLLPFIGSGGSSTQEDREERYNITDILYVTRASMSWKFGIDISHSLQNEMPLFAATGGRYNIGGGLTNSTGGTNATGGNSFAQFMLGVPIRWICAPRWCLTTTVGNRARPLSRMIGK